jgi:hypothetical protein
MALAGLLFLCGSVASAGDFSVGPQIGTLGIGVNASYQANDYLKFRLNANYLPYSTDRSIRDIDYKADFDSFTIGGLVDVHPFAGHFRLSAGLYYVNMDLDVKGKLKSGTSVKIGDHKYNADDLGTWKGSAEWKKVAPYVGLGFGSGDGSDSGFSFSADAGVLFFGKPKVSLNPSSDAYSKVIDEYGLRDDVNREKNNVKNKISNYLPVWPVISLGFTYRF